MAEINTAPIELPDGAQKLLKKICVRENLQYVRMNVSEASEKGDNYLGQLYRVKVEDPINKKTQSFIVKCAPLMEQFRQVSPVHLFYIREINAYRKVLPTLYKLQDRYIPQNEKFTHAKYYDCIEEEPNEIIVLEDLGPQGYKMYNRKNPFDKEHLELVIRTLARFHATSFYLKKKNPKLFKNLSSFVGKGAEYGDQADLWFSMGKTKCVSVLNDPEVRKRADEGIGNMYESMNRLLNPDRTEPYNVICHGDCWINNFLFKYENNRPVDMKFVDLQLIRVASPITDLAYMMFSSTDSKIRSNHYEYLLDLYYKTLDMNITHMGCQTSECYPIEVYRDQIKSTMPLGIMFGIMLIPIILTNKDNVPDMDEMSPDDLDESMFDKLLSDECIERLNGVAKDCVKYGYI